MRLLFISLFLASFLFNSTARSNEIADLFEWSSSNVQLLYGDGFKLSDNAQTTFTFEHVHGWKYGDNFFYVDYSIGEPADINAEFAPRISMSKVFNTDMSIGIIQDVLLAGTWETARNFDAYLYGIGFDLNIPGFNFLQVNGYERNNPDVEGKGWQITTVWSYPFELNGYKMTFDGYFDYANYEEGEKNFFTQPQLLLDIGDTYGIAEPGKAFAGIEYRYWHDKYGIDGVTEVVPQIMVKWVF